LKPVFTALYLELGARGSTPYSQETRHADLLNDLARHIQDGSRTQALEALKRVQEAHSRDLEAIGAGRQAQKAKDRLRELVENPLPLIGTFVIYIALVIVAFRNRRSIVRAIWSVRETQQDRDEARRLAARREEALKALQDLSPEGKALAIGISR